MAKKWIRILDEDTLDLGVVNSNYTDEDYLELLSHNIYENDIKKVIVDRPLYKLSAIEKIKSHFGETISSLLDNNEPVIYLFHSSKYEEHIQIYQSRQLILVNDFFYHIMVGRIKMQFHSFITCLQLILQGEHVDFYIDLHQHMSNYYQSRTKKLKEQEQKIFADDFPSDKDIISRSLCFVSLAHNSSMDLLSSLEKKVIRDILGTSHAKRLLGLEENAYTYLEKDAEPADQSYANEMEIYNKILPEIEEHKVYFENYITQSLRNKNILIWTWWTISPFVSADLNILLPMLAGAKTIKRIYIDLYVGSQDIFNSYLKGELKDESLLEEEIKKIYPPVLKDYQKETLPYLVILEKLKELNIPVECFGFDGIELMEQEPYLNQSGELEYSMDKRWKQALLKEHATMTVRDDPDELVIFFQFMKPMYSTPSNINDQRIEKIIHTDKFTGFGPKKPENALSIFSRHGSKNQRSFCLTPTESLSFKDQSIVYFPYMEDQLSPKLNDDKFNRFCNYNSIIYSSYSGGGGGNKELVEDPTENIFQPA